MRKHKILCVFVTSLWQLGAHEWAYECASSKYKHVVLAFYHMHSIDVLVSINNTLLLLLP